MLPPPRSRTCPSSPGWRSQASPRARRRRSQRGRPLAGAATLGSPPGIVNSPRRAVRGGHWFEAEAGLKPAMAAAMGSAISRSLSSPTSLHFAAANLLGRLPRCPQRPPGQDICEEGRSPSVVLETAAASSVSGSAVADRVAEIPRYPQPQMPHRWSTGTVMIV